MADTSECRSLAPVLGHAPQWLVLGSMPGTASIEAQKYYAHPRNRFWPLMAQLLGQPLPDSYSARTRMLTQAGFALWDVLARCERQGSLDASIVSCSEQANNVPGLLTQHAGICGVLLNGGAAARYYLRLIQPQLPQLAWHALPSTSPANARYALSDLHAEWAAAVGALTPAGA